MYLLFEDVTGSQTWQINDAENGDSEGVDLSLKRSLGGVRVLVAFNRLNTNRSYEDGASIMDNITNQI